MTDVDAKLAPNAAQAPLSSGTLSGSRGERSAAQAQQASKPKTGSLQDYLGRFINKWKGTPYNLGGCSRMGVDCSHLIFQLTGGSYKTTGSMIKNPMGWQPVDRGKVQIGDVVVVPGRKYGHTGVCVGFDSSGKALYLHASGGAGKVVVTTSSRFCRKEHWGQRKFFRPPYHLKNLAAEGGVVTASNEFTSSVECFSHATGLNLEEANMIFNSVLNLLILQSKTEEQEKERKRRRTNQL